VLPGQRVAAGQLLGLLAPNFSEAATRIAEAEGDFATAKASLEQAEAAYARTKRLAAEKAKSERELQEAELAVASARARHAAAAGILGTFRQSDGIRSPGASLQMELRAPIAGVLTSVAAGPGELLSTGQQVFSGVEPGDGLDRSGRSRVDGSPSRSGNPCCVGSPGSTRHVRSGHRWRPWPASLGRV
jgi:multidrug resistance efflux pump